MILVDSNFFIALANSRDRLHSRAMELVGPLLRGEWGVRVTTDYILDETITTTWIRTRDREAVKRSYGLFHGNHAIAMMGQIPGSVITSAWEVFLNYAEVKRPLSYTDCTLIAYAREKGIDTILSFDHEFDGIVTRIA